MSFFDLFGVVCFVALIGFVLLYVLRSAQMLMAHEQQLKNAAEAVDELQNVVCILLRAIANPDGDARAAVASALRETTASRRDSAAPAA